MFDNPLLDDVKKVLDINNYLVRSYSNYEKDTCQLIIPRYGSIIYKADRINSTIEVYSGARFTIWDVPEYAITPVVIADIEQKLLLNFLYALDALSCHDEDSLHTIPIDRLFKKSKDEEVNKKEDILFQLSFNLNDPETNSLAKDLKVEEGLKIIRGILLEK